MGVSSFVKFCKIGALSATGSRPYAEGADGFVMGEGAAVLIMKRLADAERDGDKIYAVLRGMAGSSDGQGQGNHSAQSRGPEAMCRTGMAECRVVTRHRDLNRRARDFHDVGDLVEAQALSEVLASHQARRGSVALGSVKSNIGHLKAAAGAAGLLKAALALRDKVLPPSVHYDRPNPNMDFEHSPLYVNTALREWTTPADGVRRAGVSAFGFGGTNFHPVLEEYIPHRLNGNGRKQLP